MLDLPESAFVEGDISLADGLGQDLRPTSQQPGPSPQPVGMAGLCAHQILCIFNNLLFLLCS